MGFPGYSDQSALSFLKGRLSRCLSIFSLIVELCRGRKFSCSGFLFYNNWYSLAGNKSFGFLNIRIFSSNIVFFGGVLLTFVLR